MSERWAAIVYGRTYHLDFRFITIPHNFTPEDLSWASQHIVATTQQARNLSGSPRWSLVKNSRFCMVGVTTAVKDLIGATVKDDRGRPLYVFVGYVAELSSPRKLENFPAYSSSLNNFKILYQEIESVWLVKNYDANSREPKASQYYSLTFYNPAFSSDRLPGLNHNSQDPHKIYLWPNFAERNQSLWQTACQCSESTSVCLNIKGKVLVNSPFLNLSSDRTEQFQILDRVTTRYKPHCPQPASSLETSLDSSFGQKISQRARNDLDLTLQQAAKMALASQELLGNLADLNQPTTADSEAIDDSPEASEFGFKKKPDRDDSNWF